MKSVVSDLNGSRYPRGFRTFASAVMCALITLAIVCVLVIVTTRAAWAKESRHQGPVSGVNVVADSSGSALTPVPTPTLTPVGVALTQCPPDTNIGPWDFGLLVMVVVLAGLTLGRIMGVSALLQDAPTSTAPISRQSEAQGRSLSLLLGLVTLVTVGVTAIRFIPELRCSGTWIVIDFTALGLCVVGGGLGFLFGLPVYVGTAPAGGPAPVDKPGTSLESIIAKFPDFLAGATIASLISTVTPFVLYISDHIGISGPGFYPISLIALAITLYFFPLGFIFGFLITRTIVTSTIAVFDESLLLRVGTAMTTMAAEPNLPIPAGPDAVDQATKIVQIPYAQLTSAAQKSVWAQAKLVLRQYADAELALQDARVQEPDNAEYTLQYVLALYSDSRWTDYRYLLDLLDKAEPSLPAPSSTKARQLRCGAMLSIPGLYVDVIALVNQWIRTSMPPTSALTRYYRMAALGQLYRAWTNDGAAAFGPIDKAALDRRLADDFAITIAIDPDAGDAVRVLAAPYAGRTDSSDDDLQLYTTQTPTFGALLGLGAAIPQPDPPMPPLVVPPAVAGVAPQAPAQAGYVDGGTAAWIAAMP